MLKQRSKGRLLREVEKAGNDDFGLILLAGPKAYATHELHVLLRLLRIKVQQVNRIRRWSYILGWLLPFSLFVATITAMQGWLTITYLCLALAPLTLGAMILLEGWQARVLSVYDQAGEVRTKIETELAWRRANQEFYH